MKSQKLEIAGRTFESRLFLGTGKFGSLRDMVQSVIASETDMVTMALKRIDAQSNEENLLDSLRETNVHLLPNTSGARTAKEAVLAAQLAREALETNWVKLEIHPDPKYLLPDPIETLYATEELAKLGFVVMPYIHADPVLCRRLEDAGTAVVMPLGAPIGTNKGLRTQDFLEIIISQSNVPVVVDAGIGAPSDAAKAMEMGADAVLVNTAIAVAKNPLNMAVAFKEGVIAGRRAFESGLGAIANHAEGSSPLTSFLFE
ncbi:thiazole synthase [Chryseobacterium sediminis]|uniref:thiazole synthase n=1 Tax=Chryseobacterium sediminis TaxID=1679494 RepID=UPI002856A23B|nr:thiazole synthase [Chryseobacterium sediminis]MDR6465484.1 thiazole synthase [Chryseobacterium sediminis]